MAEITKYLHKNAKSLNDGNVCNDHPYSYLISDQHSGDLLCSDCGYVVDSSLISDQPEWRTFENDIDKWEEFRVDPFKSNQSKLGSFITRNSKNKWLSPFGFNVLKQKKRFCGKDALLRAQQSIMEMCERIFLPKAITYRACKIYNDAYKLFKLKGNVLTIDPKVPAAVYIACRLENCSRTFREIAAICETERRCIIRQSNRILKALSITLPEIDITQIVNRICNRLCLRNEIKKEALDIANSYHNVNTPNMCSESIAGAIIYLAHLRISNDLDAETEKAIIISIGNAVDISFQAIQRSYEFLLKESYPLTSGSECSIA